MATLFSTILAPASNVNYSPELKVKIRSTMKEEVNAILKEIFKTFESIEEHKELIVQQSSTNKKAKINLHWAARDVPCTDGV